MGRIKDFFKYSKEDSLIRDSAVLFIATSGLSLAGFLFHFFMGRLLGPASYGILGTIFSIFYFILVGVFVIQTTITNFVAMYNAKQEYSKINILLRKALKKIFYLSLVVMLLFLLISPLLSRFLHIDVKYLWIITPMILFSFLLPINRGAMQGLEWFKKLGINMTLEGVAKLILGITFILIGWGVSGAIFALTFSYVVPFVMSFYILRNYLKNKEDISFDSKAIYKYSIPVIISLFLFTGFYTIDVLLVKHFFEDSVAGLYVALTFLGKIIFFGTQSISFVLFPKSVASNAVNKISRNLVNKAMIIVGILGGCAVFVYLVFPKIAITILYGKEYLCLTSVLG